MRIIVVTGPGGQHPNAYTVATYDNYKKAANPSDIKWAFVGSNTPNTKAIMNALGAVAKGAALKDGWLPLGRMELDTLVHV